MGTFYMKHALPEYHDAKALHDVDLEDGGQGEHLLGGTVLPRWEYTYNNTALS